MDLENHVLNQVSNYVQNLAMNARNERHLIPEWYQAVQSNMDHDQGTGPSGLSSKMVKYTQWVEFGQGDDWFVDTDNEDQFSPESGDDELQRQRDEDLENHYSELYKDITEE